MRDALRAWWRSPMRNDDIFYGSMFAAIISGAIYGMFKIGWL